MADRALPGHIQALRRRLTADGLQVDLVQTHISYVLLTPDEVWKLKKPVDLGFLDYGTVEQRKFMCEEEVRLNARLAPGVYLSVEPLDRNGSTGGKPVDYAVRMRRLPEANMLDRRVLEGMVSREDASEIGKLLASFHLTSRARGSVSRSAFGAHLKHWEDNFGWLQKFPDLLDPLLVEQCRRYKAEFVARNRGLLEERHLQKTVDGHGDLRAEHICLLDMPVVFDCIEFSEELRNIDGANDLAFLLMDLEFLGKRQLANAVAEAYVYWTRDSTAGAVLDFYRCYRAVVRAKVEAIKSNEAEVEDQERDVAARRARRYLALARQYANPVRLIIVRGYSGTGKSTIAARLAATGAVLLSTDVIRGELAREQEPGEPPEAYREGLYEPKITARVYRRLVEQAADHLIEGRSVVLDGTFLPQSAVDAVAWLRGRWPGPAVSLVVDPGEERVRANLQHRSQQPDVSEADLQVYLEQKRREELLRLRDVPEVLLREKECDLSSDDLLGLTLGAARASTECW